MKGATLGHSCSRRLQAKRRGSAHSPALSHTGATNFPKTDDGLLQCPGGKRCSSNSKIISAARELRDRWLERINSQEFVLTDQRYDIARIECQSPSPQRLLPAA
jgi:hypothetical protein